VPPLQSAAGCEETANRQRGATELQNSISHTNKGGGAKSRIKFWGGVDFCLRVLWQSYVDFILSSPGLLRHQFLRRLWALRQRWSTALFLRTIERAHRYQITSLETLERIGLLELDDTALPDPVVDPELEKRPAYQEGSLTDTPDLSRYDD